MCCAVCCESTYKQICTIGKKLELNLEYISNKIPEKKASKKMLTISRANICHNMIPSAKNYYKYSAFRNVTLASKRKGGVLENLSNRSLLRMNGKEVSTFLQGLITNDMRHLEEGAKGMYAMFLNTKGRVMYDTIIYRTNEDNVFYIECDAGAVSHLKKHLKTYCLRKKIDIDDMADKMNVWALFYPETEESEIQEAGLKVASKNENHLHGVEDRDDIIICRDPRLRALGVRILAPTSEEVVLNQKEDKSIDYNAFRYKLGVGEGTADLPPGNCFPLESNGDYLHGVSFHKGCYIGQELTARTHHTGVVRKRLMPLMFSKLPQETLSPDASIVVPDASTKLPLGKLRGVAQNFGLALLRVDQALALSEIKVLDGLAETKKPSWWPQEAPRDRLTSNKSE